MRNHLRAALESADNNVSYGVLSMEEEAQLLTEATQDEAAATTDLNEIARMNDMSEAIEDLAVIADGIEGEPSQTEAALIDNTAQMAVAGTEVAPEEVVPAMESYRGRKIATEGLRETARNIWESIKRILKKVWEKIESFFYKIFGTIPGLRRSIKSLKDKVRDLSGSVSEKKITVSAGVQSVSVDYKTPKNEGDLKASMKTLTTVVEDIFGPNASKMVDMGEAIVDGLNDFDPADPKKSLGPFVGKIGKIAKGAVEKTNYSAISGNRWPGFKGKISDPLPGNVSIVSRMPNEIDARHDDVNVGKLEALRRVTVEVVATSDKSKDVPNSFEMSTMGTSAMLDLLEDAESILDKLEQFQRGKHHADMKKTKAKLDTASDKATSAMAKAEGKSDDKEAKDSVPYYRALLNFNTAYARWSKDPAMPMVSHSLAFIRGVITCVQKSAAEYK